MHTLSRDMGRPKQFKERMHLTLPEGTQARATAVLEDGEDRMSLAREAYLREIKRRERSKRREDEA